MKEDLDLWLAKTEEEALEPDLAICDPHHHLWDHPESRYLSAELLDDLGTGHRVESTVFIECMSKYRKEGPEQMRPVGETEFVVREAVDGEKSGVRTCAGIVGYADLTLGDAVAEVLEAHIDAGADRFRGIRHAAGWDESGEVRNSHTNPPRGLYADSRFREGFAQLERHDLSFEAWQYHTQLNEVADLARAFPGTRIVLNHLGGPLGIGPYEGRRDEILAIWRQGIVEVASCQNVVVKLGGLQMKICGFDWHRRETPPSSAELAKAGRPYYEHCIESFGPGRGMFESNFPVDKLSCSYGALWNAFKRLAAGYSEDEKAALFMGTAAGTYRI